jgi:DNA-binding response OmpR family regulator
MDPVQRRRGACHDARMAAPLKILVIENDENEFHLINSALRKSNIRTRVHWAHNIADAQAYLAGDNDYADRTFFPYPDLIVLDLKQPHQAGFDFLSSLNEIRDRARPPVVVVSTTDSAEAIERAYALGAANFSIKPVDLDRFNGLFKSIVEYWSHSLHSGATQSVNPFPVQNREPVLGVA